MAWLLAQCNGRPRPVHTQMTWIDTWRARRGRTCRPGPLRRTKPPPPPSHTSLAGACNIQNRMRLFLVMPLLAVRNPLPRTSEYPVGLERYLETPGGGTSFSTTANHATSLVRAFFELVCGSIRPPSNSRLRFWKLQARANDWGGWGAEGWIEPPDWSSPPL